jgi:hypothetical protein
VPNLKAVDLRVMIPAKNFAVSKEFYEAIGCVRLPLTREVGLVALWRLIARCTLRVDLTAPITFDSRVSAI